MHADPIRPPEESVACAFNIDRAGRQRRRAAGWAAIVVGGAAAAALLLFGAEPLWRVTVLLPFFAGTIGVIQAREGT